MRKLDERVLKALCNLEGNPDFRVIQEWFLESAADQDQTLRSAESAPLIYRAQGAVKELLQFCEIASTPKELAGKMAMKRAGVHSIP
ncbi:MAG TPA: hypothetical protein ENJ35_04240 [Gammaproteobacteria bacterium]|nr:hypothetical protein [Gammaproteobacteria bacterium]